LRRAPPVSIPASANRKVPGSNARTPESKTKRTASEANAISVANGIGLDGGADGDTLRNLGTITGTVDSRAVARGIAIAGLGAGTAAANSTGRAESAGLAGGAGDDRLENSGSVDLTLDATAIGQAISGSLAGASISDASANAIVAMNDTPRTKALSLRRSTSQPWATDCIQVPLIETIWERK